MAYYFCSSLHVIGLGLAMGGSAGEARRPKLRSSEGRADLRAADRSAAAKRLRPIKKDNLLCAHIKAEKQVEPFGIT